MLNIFKKLRLSTSDDKKQDGHKEDLAACVLLLEAAHADNECAPDELRHIIETMQSTFDIGEDEASELVELALEAKDNSTDLYEFTSSLNKNFTRDQKKHIMLTVWRIIYKDGKLDKHENHFAGKLYSLLGLDHKEMIELKLKAKAESSA